MKDLDVLPLEEVMRLAREATPFDRIDYRDAIARHGLAGVEAMEDWLGDPVLGWFALRVVGRAGDFGAHEQAVRILARLVESDPSLRDEVELELRRLGVELKKPKRSAPSWTRRHPYDVDPLSPLAGMGWPGFQAHEFGNLKGTAWRRRDDPMSLPPIILRPLRELHPHFNSWAVSRSPEVHFAITDRYRQFDDPGSAWRAAKLIVYAHGPTEEDPDVVARVIAGLNIEKGPGNDWHGEVDARWDWPRFVTSLGEPAINERLTEAMVRHDLQLGDLFSQNAKPAPDQQIGGVGRIEQGVLVFRSHDGEELFRGWEALRQRLEALPADQWHDFFIWRSWPADEAIRAGHPFAAEALVPLLTALGSIYLTVIKDAIESGTHGLNRIVQRRTTADGRPEIVFLVQAHEQPGHFGVPLAIMAELGIPPGGRIQLSVSTLEDRQYFIGTLDTRSGPEVYYRVGDPETDGLQQIGSKEWILVAASKPTSEAPSSP